MDKIVLFKDSLKEAKPLEDFSKIIKALWFDGKGDWKSAHELIDQLQGQDAAWVHAYLHRKEGDLWNADYWYARAKKSRPNVSLQEEWEELVAFFM